MHSLDLRFSGGLNPLFCRILTKIAKNKVRLFNKLMGLAYKEIPKENFEDFICTPASSRNPFSSKVFFYFCCFFLVKKLLKEKYKISNIYVDSNEFKLILMKLVKNKSKIIIFDKSKKNNNLNKLKSFFYFFIRIVIIKTTSLFFKVKNPRNISTLISTNVIKNYINKDRYFPNITEKIYKKNIFIAPNILVFNYYDLFKSCFSLRKSKNQFIIKEDYINFIEVLCFIGFFYRIKNLNLKKIKFLEFNFSKILYEDLVNPLGNFSIFESMLNIKFISKIKKKNLKINSCLTWFENQNIDRSFTFSINKHFTSTCNFGYRGMVPSDLYLSQHHTIPEDRLFNIIPNKIFVIGKGFVNEIKKYDKKLDIEVGPALRFNHLWTPQKIIKQKNIVVPLPIFYDESFFIINLIKEILITGSLLEFNFYFLPHPTHDFNKINTYIKKCLFKNMILKNLKFLDLFKISFAVISGMSSTCLESIASGKKTVIIEFYKSFAFSCVPKQVNKKLFILSSNKTKIVNYLSNVTKKKADTNLIKNLYFSKPSLYTRKRMLNL